MADITPNRNYTRISENGNDPAVDIANSLYQMVTEIDTDVQDIVDAITNDINQNVESLGNRVTTNEEDISSLDTRVTTNEGDISSLDTRVTTNEGDISSLDTRVTTNEEDISSLDTRVTTNEEDISSLTSAVSTAISAGAVMTFATPSAPAGWLKADGSAVSRSEYPNLFLAIGTLYGAGNGSTTFNLPDLRGEFVRGLDDGRGVDSFRTLGSFQIDVNKEHNHNWGNISTGANGGHSHTTPNHTHTLTDPGHTHQVTIFEWNSRQEVDSGSFYKQVWNSQKSVTYTTASSTTGISIASGGGGTTNSVNNHSHTIPLTATSVTGNNEARPRNIALLYCIKY
jgi:microcystin-dependent protein